MYKTYMQNVYAKRICFENAFSREFADKPARYSEYAAEGKERKSWLKNIPQTDRQRDNAGLLVQKSISYCHVVGRCRGKSVS